MTKKTVVSIECPHCGKQIIAKDYKVTYLTKDGKKGWLIWEDCYTAKDAAHTMIYFDEDVATILKVEET